MVNYGPPKRERLEKARKKAQGCEGEAFKLPEWAQKKPASVSVTFEGPTPQTSSDDFEITVIDEPDQAPTQFDIEQVREFLGGKTYRLDGLPDISITNPQPEPVLHDPVNHPSHYTTSPACCSGCGKTIECIDVVRHMNFTLGSALKYLWRHGKKDDVIQDLQKSVWYIQDEIARLERERDSSKKENP